MGFGLFFQAPSDKTRKWPPTCANLGFRLDIRKNIFTEGVKYWNRLPMEAVETPSLQVFERRVEVQLSDMV